ncbi:DENN domain-containing protein 10 isoform X2 [Rhinoraja longicauda]
MAGTPLMLSVGLVEKDTNGDALWVWCYPTITAELRELLLRKCSLTGENDVFPIFVFGQFKRTWYYITTTQVQDPTALSKVTHFSIVLTAKDFNPEKYAAFGRVLCRTHMKYGDPAKITEGYISVLTSGICQSEENGSFFTKDYDAKKAYLAGSIKDIVNQFGMETIILYTGLMLRKRIVVYHPRIEALQEFSRTLPTLTWHRQDWSILHPYMHLNQDELEALKTCTETMTMGKLQKDIGQLIVQSAGDPEKSDGQVIKDISHKTKEILTTLASLGPDEEGKSKITLEILKERRFPPATESFLYHLAAAEQMLQI